MFINIYTYLLNRPIYNSIFEFCNNDDIGQVREFGD